jgi:3-oxoacyl-[acyl-carrier protein] reductase
MMDLTRTAVITGGSSGIGKAIVKRLARDGYRVAFTGLTPMRVSQTVSELESEIENADIMGRAFDIREAGRIQSFFDEVQHKFGDAGILINNAAISPKENGSRIPTHKLTLAQFEDVIAANLTAPLLCTQRVLPGMMQARFGRIIMIGSLAARTVPKFAGSAYVASKAGLAGLARALVGEYAAFGITTNIVSPGNVATRMISGNSPAAMQAAVDRIPAGRLGMPEDFPGIVAFLCSQEAAFINGATIDVTGGEYVPA